MPARPALAPWLRVVSGEDQLLLEHGGTVVAFEGKAAAKLLPSLLPLLDGTRTLGELVQALGEGAAAPTENALALLHGNGALVDGPQPLREDGLAVEAAVHAAAIRGSSPAAALESLTAARVAVSGLGVVAAEVVRGLMASNVAVRQVDVDDPGEPEEFLVAAPTPGEITALASINAARLALRAPWLQVEPGDGLVVAVGPLFVPGTTGCHTCYALRRGACSGYEDDYARLSSVASQSGAPAPLAAVSGGIAALLVLRWLATNDPALPGRFYAFETGTILGLAHQQLLRVPRCPTCGSGRGPTPSPWFSPRASDG